MSTEQYWGYFVYTPTPTQLHFTSLPYFDKLYAFPILMTVPLHFASLQINHDIYVTGGTGSGSLSVLSNFTKYSFNPVHKLLDITIKPPMLYPRLKHSFVNIDDQYLYAIGGHGKNGKRKVCEKYSLKSNRWYIVPSLNYPRLSATACVMQNYIYLIGGYTGKRIDVSSQFEKLDVNDESSGWTIHAFIEGSPLVEGRVGAGAFLLSPCDILIFGGTPNTASTLSLRFDTTCCTVSKLHKKTYVPYDDKYRNVAPFFFNSKVYVVSDCVVKKCYWRLKEKWWAILE